MRFFLVILLAVAISGCETFGTRITDDQLSNINKVGLISLIDDQISYNYVGITVFNNKNSLYPFEGLEIDRYVTSTISAALQRANPRVEVVPIDVDFGKYRDSYSNPKTISSFDINSFTSKVSTQASDLGIKYVIVASRDNIQFDDAPITVNGFGLRKRIGQEIIGSFVLIKFQLIDVTTGQEIAKARVFERDRNSDFEWKEPFYEYDESEVANLKQYIYSSVEEWSKSVASTLIQSPYDFQVCSQKVYSSGFDIDGNTYYTREEVVKLMGEYRYNKIVKENIDPKESNPPYQNRYEATEEQVLDCIAELVKRA